MAVRNPSRPESHFPFAKSAAAIYLTRQLDALMNSGEKMTQREIARAAGYDKPNIFSMFKQGETKIPIDKIPQMAKALKVDVAHFGRLVILQHWPNLGSQFEAIFGSVISANEKALVELWRATTGDGDVTLDTQARAEMKAAMTEIAKRLHERNNPNEELVNEAVAATKRKAKRSS